MAETYDLYRPEWQPEGADGAYAGRVMTGVADEGAALPDASRPQRRRFTAEDYVAGILAGNRMILSKAITVIESNAPKHFELGQQIVSSILPHTGQSIRVGITGVPGAGKSTFIEALGTHLCRLGHKVAVLAVDPSSSISNGSILGDKTRMEQLSREPNAFIRPSPSGGTLGGVTRKSRETMLLCEAAGYDVILVETVGVGQSETTVRGMVDYFLMVAITGAGDDLQGIKKGIMELADSILVNKADGDNRPKALVARADFDQMLHYLRPATEGWHSRAYVCSSVTGEGVPEMWDVICQFKENVTASGVFERRRREQNIDWVSTMVDEFLHDVIERNPVIVTARSRVNSGVADGSMTPTAAAREIISAIEKELFKE